MFSDINECALYDDLCGEHAHCVNTLGSYKCSCNRHYIGDGVICLQSEFEIFAPGVNLYDEVKIGLMQISYYE